MSMWEIEALITNTVRLIDNSDVASSEKRNLIWNAYQMQRCFDCGFTHFRVMDILIKNEYVQTYAIDEFPMSKEYPDFFNELRDEYFEQITKNPTEEWSKTNPVVAYWDKESGKIYADFGSALYTKNPTETITKYDPYDFGYLIIKEANRQKNESMVYDWTSFMTIWFPGWFPSNKALDNLKRDYFSGIKDIFQQFDYTDYEALHEGLDIMYNKGRDWFPKPQKQLIEFVTQK